MATNNGVSVRSPGSARPNRCGLSAARNQRAAVQRRAVLAAAAATCVLAAGCFTFPPTSLPIPTDAVTLIIVNESHRDVRSDVSFRRDGAEVRRVSRFLPPNGRDSVVQVVPTLVDAIDIDAGEAASPNEQTIGKMLLTRRLKLGADFGPGQTITVIIGLNPILVVVSPNEVVSGDVVRLSALQSADPEGGPLSFRWKQSSGPAVAPPDDRQALLEFVAPVIPIGGQAASLSFEVTAADENGQESSAGVDIRVRAPDAIRVTFDSRHSLSLGEAKSFAATITGGVGPFSVAWTQLPHPRGIDGALTGANGNPAQWFPPPNRLGVWNFVVKVVDAQGNEQQAGLVLAVRGDGDDIQCFVNCLLEQGAACDECPYADMDFDSDFDFDDLPLFSANLLAQDEAGR